MVTVAQLIAALSRLPQDTVVKETRCFGEFPVRIQGHHLFFVYERDGVTELHIDDGQASHPSLDGFRTELEF